MSADDPVPAREHGAMGAKGAPPAAPEERFAAALLGLEEELDWRLLGQHYCSEGGEDFFGPEQVEALRDSGLKFAGDVAQALEGAPKGLPSLYVGAGVAELAPILCERILLRREVTVVGLPGVEAKELNRALSAVEARLGLPLPRWSTRPLAQLSRRGYHLLWLVSVLTDPEEFPSLNRLAYEQRRPRPKPLARERVKASALVAEALGRLELPAVLFSTDEELPLVEAVARELGLGLVVGEAARLSGIVGDPVRVVRVTASRG